jgi:tetratricopeptide (TPR) repeat protein
LEDSHGIAKAQYFQGFILYDQGEYAEAEKQLLTSQEMFSEMGNGREEAMTALLLARVYYEMDETSDKAEQKIHRAWQMLGTAEAKNEQISILRLLTRMEIRKGNLDTAEAYATRALNLGQEVNNKAEIGAVFYQLTTISMLRQDYETAEKLAEKSLGLFRQLGNKRLEGLVLHELSVTYLRSGKYQLAQEIAEQTLKLFRQIEDRLSYGYALRQLGDSYMKLEQTEKAFQAWDEAHQIAKFLSHNHLLDQLRQRIDKTSY